MRLVNRAQFLDEFGGAAAPQAGGGELPCVNVGVHPAHREGLKIVDVPRLFSKWCLEGLAGEEPAPFQWRREDDLHHCQVLTDAIGAIGHCRRGRVLVVVDEGSAGVHGKLQNGRLLG